MALGLYDKGREKFLGPATGQINWTNDNIKVVLIDEALYTVNLVTHEFLSDIPAGARISTTPNLTGKTIAAGVADAADAVFTAVSGATAEAIAIYKDTGVAATSPLISYDNVASGVPLTPTGSDVTVVWDSGPNKVFKL
jgi:hypothetical protein